MAKVIIHAGMSATGMGSIQRSLEGLDDGRFVCPELHETLGHGTVLLGLFAADPGRHPELRKLTQQPEKLKMFVAMSRARLRRAIASAGERTLILAAESVLNMTLPELRQMKLHFVRRGLEVRVTAYVPDPHSAITTAFENHVRSGKPLLPQLPPLVPLYKARLAKLDAVFGRPNVSLWPHGATMDSGERAVRDFCRRLEVMPERLSSLRTEQRIPRDMVALILQYGVWTRAQKLPRPSRKDMLLLADMLHLPDAAPLRFSASLLQPVLAAHTADMAWIEDRLGQAFPAPPDGPAGVQALDELLVPAIGVDALLRREVERIGGTPVEGEDAGPRMIHMLLAAKAHPPPPRPPRVWPRELRSMPVLTGNPITDSPRPMVNRDKKLTVLWSPKSACTTAYVWFSHVSGFGAEVRDYANWPHRHRQERYQHSHFYAASLLDDPLANHVLRIIREPYGRAVSIYRHALQTDFADRRMARFAGGRFNAESGYSFQTFLDLLATLDMPAVDIHFRPQFHPVERVRKPDRIINISKQNLMAELNAFERQCGWPETDFTDLRWLNDMERHRKAKQEPLPGIALDETVFSRKQVTRLREFPSYEQLLTPEARAKIAAIYKVDFDAYADYL